MDKCIYNGKVINSFDIAADIDLEMMFRQCSELQCCDPECNAPVRYRHGKIRIPHFAHITANTECDYERYSSKKSDVFQKVQQEIYEILKRKYPQSVEIDIKLIKSPPHYTPIILKDIRSDLAIDITDKRITANTLQSRKEAYSKLGYKGIQIIIDEAMDNELSESHDLYLPVRYELNKSANNSAVVYDKISAKYYYLRYDDNKYEHTFYINNVISKEFSIDEIKFTEQGLSVPRLDNEYKKWIENRQNKDNEYLKAIRKAEEQRKRIAEERITALNGKQSITPYKKEIVKKPKSTFDPVEFHKQTGRYAGNFAKGVRESLSLNEIQINKTAPNYFKVFSENEIEELINKAFTFTVSDIRQLINKMYHANYEEKAVFVRIYEEYLNAEQTVEVAEKLKILEYAIIEAEIFD